MMEMRRSVLNLAKAIVRSTAVTDGVDNASEAGAATPRPLLPS